MLESMEESFGRHAKHRRIQDKIRDEAQVDSKCRSRRKFQRLSPQSMQ